MGIKWQIFKRLWTEKSRDEIADTIGEAIAAEVFNPERLRHYGTELKPLALDFLKAVGLAVLDVEI